MSLIKCEECGKEFSDKAKACPNCACPFKIKEKKKISKKRKIYLISGIIVGLVIIALILIILLLFNKPYYVGKWEHHVHWIDLAGNERDSYAYYQFYKNGTFKYEGYNLEDKNNITLYEGHYNENDGTIHLYYDYYGTTYTHSMYVEEYKLCDNRDIDCYNYHVKTTSKEKKHITLNERAYIPDESYQKIIQYKADAIVVAYSETCHHCQTYDYVLFRLYNRYQYPIYHYDIHMENATLNIESTPTTLIIKKGRIVDKIEGYIDYDELLPRVTTAFLYSEEENNNGDNSNNNSSNNNSTNNNNSKPNNNNTQQKVCDESAKQKLTNEYQTTLNQKENEYQTKISKAQQQVDIAKQSLDLVGGYLSTEEYNTLYNEATSSTQKELLKNRYNMSVTYDKMVNTLNAIPNEYNNWKNTYNAWYNQELKNIGC